MARDERSARGKARGKDAPRDNGLMTLTSDGAEANGEGGPPPLPHRPLLELKSTPSGRQRATQAAETSRARVQRHRKPGERSSSSLFVWHDPPPASRPHTAAERPRMASPPAPAASIPRPLEHLPEGQPRIRRSESVIAENISRGPRFMGVQHLARRASHHMHEVISSGADAADRLRSGSLRVVKRFEAMPRQRQILWVALPYAVVVVLVLVLVNLRGTSRAATVIEPLPVRMAVEPLPEAVPSSEAAEATAKQPEAPREGIELIAAVSPELTRDGGRPSSKANAAERDPSAAVEAQRPDLSDGDGGVWQVVRADTVMRSRPDEAGARIAKLRAKTRLLTFPDFLAEDGWVLVERSGGDVGFVRRSFLSGDVDDAHKLKKKSKRPKHPRRLGRDPSGV